jgi:hypothetical protein
MKLTHQGPGADPCPALWHRSTNSTLPLLLLLRKSRIFQSPRLLGRSNLSKTERRGAWPGRRSFTRQVTQSLRSLMAHPTILHVRTTPIIKFSTPLRNAARTSKTQRTRASLSTLNTILTVPRNVPRLYGSLLLPCFLQK